VRATALLIFARDVDLILADADFVLHATSCLVFVIPTVPDATNPLVDVTVLSCPNAIHVVTILANVNQ